LSFSWKTEKEIAIAIAIRRARILAGGASPESMANPDFKIQHPDWVRDANNKNFTQMDKIVREGVLKQQKIAMDRRAKYAGK